jgi:hypothetical protein
MSWVLLVDEGYLPLVNSVLLFMLCVPFGIQIYFVQTPLTTSPQFLHVI